jgi:hypothetical protein
MASCHLPRSEARLDASTFPPKPSFAEVAKSKLTPLRPLPNRRRRLTGFQSLTHPIPIVHSLLVVSSRTTLYLYKTHLLQHLNLSIRIRAEQVLHLFLFRQLKDRVLFEHLV